MKKHIVRTLVFLFLVCFFYKTKAQDAPPIPAKLYAMPAKDSVVLRWIVVNHKIWNSAISTGYDIYRIDLNSKIKNKINDYPIKPITLKQWAISNYAKQDDEIDNTVQDALLMMYPKEIGMDIEIPFDENVDFGNDQDRLRWFFSTLAAMKSKDAAKATGMLTIDKHVDPSATYKYVLVESGKTIVDSLASIIISPSDNYLNVQPEIHHDYTDRGKTFLSWKRVDTLNCVSTVFNVYRSDEKNGNYVKLNDDPVLALFDPFSKDTTFMKFDDKTLEKKKTYYYKIQAVNVFGEVSPFSEPYKVTEHSIMRTQPTITNHVNVDNKFNLITWWIDPIDEENVESVVVMRSQHPVDDYEIISEEFGVDIRRFRDYDYPLDAYYQIRMIGEANDTAYSVPAYIHEADSIPPTPPIMYDAICDSLGVIKLTWTHKWEEPISRFNIYRANYENEEFSRIATVELDSNAALTERIDTIFFDTISLRVLDDAVFYKMLAYDMTFNPSEFSNIIEVKRYDTLKPNFPIIRTYNNKKGSIELVIGTSSSDDVVTSNIYRRKRGEKEWHIFDSIASTKEKIITYADTAVELRKWYEYALTATDDAGLISDLSPIVTIQAYDDGVRPQINDIKTSTNKRKHSVKLSWTYEYKGIQKFFIYRATEDGSLVIFDSVNGQQREYYDEKTSSGINYTYRIKAIYFDGAESPLSSKKIVKY